MKSRKHIIENIAIRIFKRRVRSRKKKEARRRKTHILWLKARKDLGGQTNYENIIDKWLPRNLSYILSCEKSSFNLTDVVKNIPNNNGIFKVPEYFSIVNNPNPSYRFIENLLGALLTQKYEKINIDYSNCKEIDLESQVLMDIILKDIIKFYRHCGLYKPTKAKVKEINGKNIWDTNIQKMLFSVGSPAIIKNKSIKFPDIIPYPLCIHDSEIDGDPIKIREQKDLDTTKLVDYVIDCLKSLGRTLTGDKIEDLSIVIGEILINAEEHSTTKFRFSIGYFQQMELNSKQYGVFRLVILNFGKTIYEKFKDPNCPNIEIVSKMRNLSEKYKNRRLFSNGFEEESLWTLYSLQDGVTSIAPSRYRKRGSGSITFIESFFNIKGRMKEVDRISRMEVLSGRTNITFDGTYNITSKIIDDDQFKFMTFNKTGDIEEKPDSKFVKFVDNYFPGTIISAKILFNEDDLI